MNLVAFDTETHIIAPGSWISTRLETRTAMLVKIFRAFFPKPMTEEERHWAVLLAVSCVRVK